MQSVFLCSKPYIKPRRAHEFFLHQSCQVSETAYCSSVKWISVATLIVIMVMMMKIIVVLVVEDDDDVDDDDDNNDDAIFQLLYNNLRYILIIFFKRTFIQ